VPETTRTPRRDRERFGLVFALLSGSFLLSAFVSGRHGRAIPPVLYGLALLIMLRPAGLPSPRWRWPGAVLLAGAGLIAVADLVTGDRAVRGAGSLWLAALLLFTIAVVVWRVVVQHRRINLQTIFGALTGYLLIGFLFAALFGAVAGFQHGELFATHQPATNANIQYYSFVTMTTTGYGDFVPAGEPARTLAVADALSGQLFLVTLVARLVASFGTSRDQP
jgi:MFS family permease